jgi:germination protein M
MFTGKKRRINMKRLFFPVLTVMLAVALLAACAPNAGADREANVIEEEDLEPEPEILPESGSEAAVEGASYELHDSYGFNNNGRKMQITLYYQDSDGFLVPVTRRVPAQEGIARAAVSGLIDSSVNREQLGYYGLFPVLPQGTEILGLNIKEGKAVIDFSEELLNYDVESHEKSIVASVVYTLTEFATVDEVEIWIGGFAGRTLKFGTSLAEVWSRDNTMINSGRLLTGSGEKKADVYLFKNANDRYSYILPVSAEIGAADGDELPFRIVELMTREQKAGLYSQIPVETVLIGSRIENGSLILDFNEGLRSYGGGTAREQGIVEQILYSMKQIRGAERVRILINGETAHLPEGSDISRPLPFPDSINMVMDT